MLAARMREPLSARAIRSLQHPEECSIRKWLVSEHTLHLRGTPEYHAALELHTAFHGQMLAIANLINAGDYEQAERLLNAAEPFHRAGQRHHGAGPHTSRKARRSKGTSTCYAKDGIDAGRAHPLAYPFPPAENKPLDPLSILGPYFANRRCITAMASGFWSTMQKARLFFAAKKSSTRSPGLE